MQESMFVLVVLGLVLGLRHGVDWDHIAAITDITSSVVTMKEAELGNGAIAAPGGGRTLEVVSPRKQRWREGRDGFFLATMYALGHAVMVLILGLLAIWASTLLPDWMDPLMERFVGVTLLLLGLWIFYSLWRYGRSFRLQSRWMLMFSLVRRGWLVVKSKITGQPLERSHDIAQYGPKTAFGVGVIHGVGAETGSQALLLAGAAGATTALAGSLMLLSFTVGLVISNSLVAIFSVFGFISSAAKRNVYMTIGAAAGVFSLVIGAFFVAGQGAELPDLQEVLNFLFGSQ
jgi:high-affinity nickel-transport protein